MRMEEKNKPINYWIDLFSYLVENQITKIHISKEYPSYKMIKKIFSHSKFKKIKPKMEIIIKCSSPNFNEKIFGEKKFINQIKKYQKDLGIKKFYAIQWLSRGNLENENKRLLISDSNKEMINFCISVIKKKYSKFFLSFPYTESFLKFCQKNINVDGFTIYQNLEEKKYSKYLKNNNFNYVTIRPFIKVHKSKRILQLKKILRLNIKNKNILGTMISFSKKKQVLNILETINEKNF